MSAQFVSFCDVPSKCISVVKLPCQGSLVTSASIIFRLFTYLKEVGISVKLLFYALTEFIKQIKKTVYLTFQNVTYTMYYTSLSQGRCVNLKLNATRLQTICRPDREVVGKLTLGANSKEFRYYKEFLIWVASQNVGHM